MEVKEVKTKKRYGLRRDGMKDIFAKIKNGEIVTIPVSEINVSALRTAAGRLNTSAGYTKFSVSIDTVTGMVRIINNDKE